MFSPAAPAAMRAQALELMSGVRPGGNLTMLRAMAEADLRDVLPRVDVPTLVLHGEADARSPLQVGVELHERIAGSRLVVLPGVGHASNLEAAATFNSEVRRFLGDLS
jgi:pimeloyl-ACP methyl ester carboxylesterase